MAPAVADTKLNPGPCSRSQYSVGILKVYGNRLFNEDRLSPLQGLENREGVLVLARGDDFIKKLVELMLAPPVAPPSWLKTHVNPGSSLSTSGLGEILCRKMKHQGWCHRMFLLEKYTRFAVNYHHARKRLRWEGADKYMSLVVLYGGLKAEARAKYRSADCNCLGLTSNDPFQASMPEQEFDSFIREFKV